MPVTVRFVSSEVSSRPAGEFARARKPTAPRNSQLSDSSPMPIAPPTATKIVLAPMAAPWYKRAVGLATASPKLGA